MHRRDFLKGLTTALITAAAAPAIFNTDRSYFLLGCPATTAEIPFCGCVHCRSRTTVQARLLTKLFKRHSDAIEDCMRQILNNKIVDNIFLENPLLAMLERKQAGMKIPGGTQIKENIFVPKENYENMRKRFAKPNTYRLANPYMVTKEIPGSEVIIKPHDALRGLNIMAPERPRRERPDIISHIARMPDRTPEPTVELIKRMGLRKS